MALIKKVYLDVGKNPYRQGLISQLINTGHKVHVENPEDPEKTRYYLEVDFHKNLPQPKLVPRTHEQLKHIASSAGYKRDRVQRSDIRSLRARFGDTPRFTQRQLRNLLREGWRKS